MHARGVPRGRGSTRTPRRNCHAAGPSTPLAMGDHVLWKGHGSDSSDSSSKNTSSSSKEETGLEGIAIVQDCSSSGDSSMEPATRERRTKTSEGHSSTSRIREDRDALYEERDMLYRPDLEKLRSIPYEELVALLPKDNEGNPGSIGSLDHDVDDCNPCAFMNRSRGCKQGIYCGFCHFQHSGESDEFRKNRPRKPQRMRFRKTVDRLKSQVEEDPVKFNADDVQFPPSIEVNIVKKEKAKAILKGHRLQTIALNVVDKYNEDKATKRNISL